jgi:hypothetical protein
MENLKRLDENRTHDDEALQRKGGAGQGEALLQGLAICGRCGRRMHSAYPNKQRPYYECRDHPDQEHTCWSAAASNIDAKVTDIFLEAFAPSEIDLSLAVFKEVERQAGDVDRQWKLRLERARYEAERAERQYNAVEPENRVVARTLETRWNEKLQELKQIECDHEEARRARKLDLSPADKKDIIALARDLPKVWHAPTTTNAERKQIIRLLIQDAVLLPVDVPQRATKIRLLWRTGAVTEVLAPRPKSPWKTSKRVLDAIRELAEQRLADVEIAQKLNRRGIKSGRGRAFTRLAVKMLRSAHDIPSGRTPGGHLPAPHRDSAGRYSVRGLAERYQVTDHIVRYWITTGVISPERDFRGGPFWLVLTPKVEERIRRALRDGYGPNQSLRRKSRAHHSNARCKKER